MKMTIPELNGWLDDFNKYLEETKAK